MATDDLLASAIDELYGLEPGEFTARRNALAASARKSGAGTAAGQISALRRPTRAAWVLNRLARAAPELASAFGALGEQLRAAHAALDGAQIRELTKQRRQLIDQTAAQAFGVAAIGNAPAALRDDVVATLGAVLADPDVAARFAAGSLVTAEDQSTFGPASTPGAQLRAVPDLRETPSPAARPDRPSGQSARAAREQARRAAVVAKAQRELETATQAVVDAEAVAVPASESVRQLADELADAKRREDDALLALRHAQLRQSKAQERLDGLVD
jgi:hypothetical protein